MVGKNKSWVELLSKFNKRPVTFILDLKVALEQWEM